LYLSGSSPELALPPLQLAWSIYRQLGPGADAESLLVDIASVPYMLVTHSRQRAAGGDGGIPVVLIGMLTTIMASASPNSAQSCSPLTADVALRRLGEFSNADEAVRLMLGCYAFGFGLSATDSHLAGAAMAWYRAAALLLESLPAGDEVLKQLMIDIAGPLYSAMAFERQIGGDLFAMRQVLDRYERYLSRLGVAAGKRDYLVGQTREGMQLNYAIATDDNEGQALHARVLLSSMSADERRRSPERFQYLTAFVDGRTPSLPQGAAASLGDPGRHFASIAARLAKAIGTGDTEDIIAMCIEGLASQDRALTWRSAALLVNLGVSREADPGRAALGVLFGKIAMRELQFLQLESIAYGYRGVSPFADGLVDKFVRDLIGILVRQGRLGEALRIERLFEADRREIPKPRVSNLESAVEDRCPLLTAERDATQVLVAMADRLETIRRTGRLRERLDAAAAMLRPQSAGQSTLDAPPELVPPPSGTAVLSVWSDDRNVIASLMGPWGGESRRLPITSFNLNERIFASLRILQTHDRASVLASCAGLHEALIAPFAARLIREAPPVLVIQSMGPLRHIPFGILFDGEQFLLERHAVVLHPGGLRIDVERGISRPLRGASLTLERTPGQQDLHAAHADGECLVNAARHHGLGEITHWRDEQVTADRLQAVARTQPTLWHLSGHFEANPTDVGGSAFVLGDGSRFTVRQLAALDWTSVELALLMGCATRSVGDGRGPSPMDALDTALLHAGVGSVVSTAWRVRDEMSHRVLGHMVEALFGAGLNQAVALQRAVLAAGRDPDTGRMAHPSAWGAYQLSGRWRGVRDAGGSYRGPK
jgi:hypothetical protein